MLITDINYKEKLIEDSAYRLLFQEFLIGHFKNIDKKYKVLEIGSGTGYFLNDLLDLGFSNVYTIDIENYLTPEIKNKVTFNAADLSFDILPFDDGFFDFIVSIQVIEHVENPWHFIREVSRVLKVDSNLIISFPTSKDIFSRLKFLKEGNVYSFTKKNNHYSFFTQAVQDKLFAGFKVHKEVYTKSTITLLRIYVLRKVLRDLFKIKYFPLRKIFSIKTLYVMTKRHYNIDNL